MQNIQMGINLSTQGLTQGLSQAQQQLTSFSNSITSMTGGKLSAGLVGFTAALGVLAVGAGAATIATIKFANEISNTADSLDENAQKLGVSIEFYQKLQSASNKTGTEIGTLTTAMKAVVNTAFDASKGNDKLASTYKSIGVSVLDSQGKLKNQEQLLGDVLLALSKMEQGTRRTAIANDLLGRSSAELAPLINEGAEAVKKYVTENNGAVLVSQRLANASSQYQDTLQQMKEIMLQTLYTAVTPFMENIAGIAENMMKSEGFKTFISWINKTGEALSTLSGYVNDISKGFAIDELDKQLEKEKAILKYGNEMTDELRRYETAYAKYKDSGTKSTIEELTARREALAVQYKALKESNAAEYERLYGAKDYKAVALEIADITSDTTDKTKEHADAYAQLLEQAKQFAKTAREGLLGETSKGKITLLEEQRAYQIDTINKVHAEDMDKAKAKYDVEVYYQKQIQDIKQADAQKMANAIGRQQKEYYDKLKSFERDKMSTTISALNTIQNVSDINKKLGVFDPRSGDPVIQAIGAEKASGTSTIMQSIEQIDALNEKLKDVPDNMKVIYQYAIAGLKELITQTKLYINISKNGLGLIDETSPLYQNAKSSVSGKPSWMTTKTRTRENPLTGEKENVEIPFGDKLSAQWDETSFGEKAQLITDIGVQTFSTINSAAQMAFDAQIARDQAEVESARKKEYARIDAMVVTSRKRKQLTDKADAEAEAKQKEIQKRQMKMQIAQLWATTAMGIAGAWAQAFATNAPIWAPIVAGVSTGLLLANAGIQTASINKNMDGLAGGGFVGGTPTGASIGPDNTRNVNLRESELVLNARQQRNVLKKINDDTGVGGNITVQIMGNVDSDSRAKELEDTLYTMQSNGRLSFIGVA